MKRTFTICALLASLAACSGTSTNANTSTAPRTAAAQTDTTPLDALLDELWALNMRTYPTWATYEGVREFDDRLHDVSDEARQEYVARFEAIAERVAALDPDTLSPVDRDTRQMVILQARQQRANLVCNTAWWDVNGLGGPQVDYPMLAVFFTIRNPGDLENLEARYRATTRQVEQTITNLRRGVSEGYAPTRANVGRALNQLDEYLESPLAHDPMLRLKDPQGASVDTPAAIREAVETTVRPALASYRDVLRDEILPAARPDQGIADLPNAELCYAARIQHHIGPGYTPDDLHQRGLEELQRAFDGMVAVGRELGLEASSHTAVIEHFATTPTYFASSEAELVDKNAAVVERAEAAMPKAFGTLPRTPIEMRPLEPHRAKDAPAAYYYGAPEDGSRPAYYYVNTSAPQTRPLFNLEALAFHEAIPGHHQQIALAREMPNVHIWRRNTGQTAFVEGWALYAEVLADELGLYTDATTRFGMYNYQAWRAARLVIDTGLHHRGWTRKKAIDFLAASTALPIGEIENEVDRYIAWPGQALAYMVGRLKIEELRRASRLALGDAFSLRDFHDAVNAGGAVPLPTLEHNIQAWTVQMTETAATLPDLREMWDFNDPVQTREVFNALLETPAVADHRTYREQLLTQIARAHGLAGDFERAHEVLDLVQSELATAEPVVEVRYLLERGRTFNSAKQRPEARPLFRRAWETASRARLDALAIDAAHMLGIVEPPPEAHAWNERALLLAEASDDPAAQRWLGALYNNIGWTRHDEGNFKQALELFQKGLAWRSEQDDIRATRIATWSVARVMRSMNRGDEALELQLELERAWDEDGEPDGYVYEEIAELHLAAGDAKKAAAYFRKALPLLEGLGGVEADRLARVRHLSGD